MQRQYNFIYTQIVKGPDDFVGHVAYSLYKRDKIDFIEEFKKKHQKEPSDADLTPFHEFTAREANIESYRIKAEITLNSFLNNVLEEAKEEAQNWAIENQAGILNEIIEPIKPPGLFKQYFTAIIQGVLSSFIYTGLVAIFFFILLLSSVGFRETMERVFKVKITPLIEQNEVKPTLTQP